VDRDEQGQMMVLAAVLLVIGLIALAGMVARVNQLGSQTAVESNQAILGELPPLADAIESGVIDLQSGRTVTVTYVAGQASLVDTEFTAGDIGQTITGPGIPPGTSITGVGDVPVTATLSATTTGGGTSVRVGTFALWASSAPTLQEGIIAMMEHLQELEAGHGLLLDYEISCNGVTDKTLGTGGNPAQGIVIAHLSDGTVWTEIKTTSAAYFTRTSPAANPCASIYG
jgi:hypothetical protein